MILTTLHDAWAWFQPEAFYGHADLMMSAFDSDITTNVAIAQLTQVFTVGQETSHGVAINVAARVSFKLCWHPRAIPQLDVS